MTLLEEKRRFRQLLKFAQSDFMTEMEFEELCAMFGRGFGRFITD
jgi:hypothetical protein